jgi:hypothetical protein
MPDAQAMNVGANLETHVARLNRLKVKHGNGNGAGLTLGIAAQLATWATPQSHDQHGAKSAEQIAAQRAKGAGVANLNEQAQLTASGPTPSGSPVPTGRGGRLNPELPRWLMGLPPAWSSCAPTATPSSRRSRRRSSGRTENAEPCRDRPALRGEAEPSAQEARRAGNAGRA